MKLTNAKTSPPPNNKTLFILNFAQGGEKLSSM
jgi:hypothetical protein